MSKASIIFIILVSQIQNLVTNHASAQPPTKPNFLSGICQPEFGEYASNSPYSLSLGTVLTTLKSESSASPNSSTTAGTDTDTVFGQYYCRGDIKSTLCGSCIQSAATSATNLCPRSKAAVVYYQECTLRYQNQTLSGVVSDTPSFNSSSQSKVTDPTSFFELANATMTEVVETALNSTKKFAKREGTEKAAGITVYCLVQCSPDLNEEQCDDCLGSAADNMFSCCGEWPNFIYVFLPSCHMMYSTIAPFYGNQ